jgi:hypothetical protein
MMRDGEFFFRVLVEMSRTKMYALFPEGLRLDSKMPTFLRPKSRIYTSSYYS